MDPDPAERLEGPTTDEGPGARGRRQEAGEGNEGRGDRSRWRSRQDPRQRRQANRPAHRGPRDGVPGRQAHAEHDFRPEGSRHPDRARRRSGPCGCHGPTVTSPGRGAATILSAGGIRTPPPTREGPASRAGPSYHRYAIALRLSARPRLPRPARLPAPARTPCSRPPAAAARRCSPPGAFPSSASTRAAAGRRCRGTPGP